MDIAIMIEGQCGLTWKRLKNLSATVEGLGFAGLYRSDHFTNARPPDEDSLELWISLTWLAAQTKRIEFGPLVSPMSFRHPVLSARMAAAVDDLSEGRLTLGLGAGWQEREHALFGFDLMAMDQRFARFREGLEVITLLLKGRQPVTFEGKYYTLHEAELLPHPNRPGGPPILIGGNGEKRTLPLVAQYADEWNAVYIPPAEFIRLSKKLDDLLNTRGRTVNSVKRSLMAGLRFGATRVELEAKLTARNQTREELLTHGFVVGIGDEIQPRIEEFKKAGVGRIMLQWMELDDLKGLAALAKVLL